MRKIPLGPCFTISLEESKTGVKVGEKFSYTLKLINTTSEPVKELEIWMLLPPDCAEILKESVAGPTETQLDVASGIVKYAPMEIQPGAAVTCKVEVKTLKAGTFQAHVQLLQNGKLRSQKLRETKIEP